MVTSSSPFPSTPSGSPSSGNDYTSSSSDDALGTSSASSARSLSGMNPSSAPSDGSRPELLDRVVRGAHETVDRLADKAKPQLQRLQEGAGSATESLQARVDHAREMGDEWAESLRTTVRENPLAAVGTALALGLIIARLSR